MYNIDSMQQMLPQILQSYSNYSSPSLQGRRARRRMGAMGQQMGAMGQQIGNMGQQIGDMGGLLEAIKSGAIGGGGGGIPGLVGVGGVVPEISGETIQNAVSNPQGYTPVADYRGRIPNMPIRPTDIVNRVSSPQGLINSVSNPQGLTKRVSKPQGGR
jgi:hypothetical protein